MSGEPGPAELDDQNLSHERRHPNHAEHVILGQTLQDVNYRRVFIMDLQANLEDISLSMHFPGVELVE